MVKTNETKSRLAVAAAAEPSTASAAEPDPFHGQGGSYVIENGVRRLVARTKSQAEAEAEAEAPAAQADQA